MASAEASKDNWSSEAYRASAAFVPKLATKVMQYLNPQPHEIILDLGCGDGPLTADIARTAKAVVGLDSSESMITTAKTKFSSQENCTFYAEDCTDLGKRASENVGKFDKIFSNAAFHWILRNPSTRKGVFENSAKMLKPGGKLVFEMGGAGNVAEVNTALLAALVAQGVPVEKAREACPWFYPSEKWMKGMLEEVGFEVEKLELEYRPTRLTDDEEGGLEGWVRLMGVNFLDVLENAQQKEKAVEFVCAVLKDVLARIEDGSMWLGYVRLRAVARKL